MQARGQAMHFRHPHHPTLRECLTCLAKWLPITVRIAADSLDSHHRLVSFIPRLLSFIPQELQSFPSIHTLDLIVHSAQDLSSLQTALTHDNLWTDLAGKVVAKFIKEDNTTTILVTFSEVHLCFTVGDLHDT
eukprot:2683036-Amphidinium_carterae.1